MTRTPTPIRPRRMEPIATVPLFFTLQDRRVVVVGGNEAAVWKAELLAAAGANVAVFDAEPCAEMETLASLPPAGTVTLMREPWTPAAFAGAAVIIGATEDEAEAARIYEAACACGVPVNVVDNPRCSTFQFGAIVNRSPLVVGISTGGAAPIFAQAVRSRIEALLPAGFSRWAAAAAAWRAEIMTLGKAARRRFWERFTERAMAAPDRAPELRDRDMALAGDIAPSGHVTLVGAGPGNPELLTLRAVRALRSADVILFDDLVAPEVLDYARREARRMLVGKSGRRPSCKQEEINALMVSLAKAGRRVVRLKAGDPLIFGRASEEIAALKAAGILVDVVPGITAAQGAAAALEVSLTERAQARRVQFVTGHAHTGALPDDLDLAALCDPNATTAVYMPLGTVHDLTRRLLAAGIDSGRPVVAVSNATRPDERVIRATVATIAGALAAEEPSGPCVLLIGEVLRARHASANATPAPAGAQL